MLDWKKAGSILVFPKNMDQRCYKGQSATHLDVWNPLELSSKPSTKKHEFFSYNFFFSFDLENTSSEGDTSQGYR